MYSSCQAGLPNFGPAGTGPFPRCVSPPASIILAPLNPFSFIASRSLVMDSFVTFAFSHHHQHRIPLSCVGVLNKYSSESFLEPSEEFFHAHPSKKNTEIITDNKTVNNIFLMIDIN